MSLKVYEYPQCSTCKKALKFLKENQIEFQTIGIVEHPPTKDELREMLGYLKKQGGSIKNLFNTSGVVYKEMKLSEKLAEMSDAEAIALLAQHGKLIKRPFILGKNIGFVGFKQEQWEYLLCDQT